MEFTWFKKTIRRAKSKRRRAPTQNRLYRAHKEQARAMVHERLAYWNQFYGFTYNKVAIRNQRSRWGSCSTNKNLNFNYRLVFLPQTLVDYVIVHELCHLQHFNHSSDFWSTVAKMLPEYEVLKQELRIISMNLSTQPLSAPPTAITS